MLAPSNLHEYQRKAILHQLHCPESMLWLDCGLGKTIVTLSSIEHRMRAGQVQKTLVIGPLRVIHSVWAKEARKWEHTKHLRFTVLHGDKETRARRLHINGSDVYLINYDNLSWLAGELKKYYLDHDKPLPFQMVVYDEVTRMKDSTSKRVAGGERVQNRGKPNETRTPLTGWRKVIPHFTFRTGLTGTPGANGYMDLHGQYLAIDNGARLGTHISHYRDAYFSSDYMGWSYQVTDLGRQAIESKIANITIKMDAADYLEVPELKINDIMIDLPPVVMAKYREVEQELYTRLDNGTEIEVFNQASVSNKCLQFAAGHPYIEPNNPEFTILHDEKLQALDSVIEEAAGQPVLVGYQFKADAKRIMERYKKLKPVNMTEVKGKQVEATIDRWNKDQIRLMIGHPASMGHGIDDLQKSGHILVWFGLPWSLELYLQMTRRLLRQGQTKPVIVHRLLCRDTLDLAVAEALRRKDDSQEGLKQAISRYRKGLAMSFL